MLALVLAAAAAPAAESDLSAKETRLLIHDYGECIVERQHERASEAIAANVGNSELMRKYWRLVDGNCLKGPRRTTIKARFKGDQYRYALADALVRKELAGMPAPNLVGVPRLDHREPRVPPMRIDPNGRPLNDKDYEKALADYQEARAFSFLSRYGECVVRANPGAAKALLLARPTSDEEASRFAAMRTALATCMPPEQSLEFSKVTLRGTIAINYYRLAKAATFASGVAR